MSIKHDQVVSVITIPAKEAEARLHGANVCRQCLGIGTYRTLAKRNGALVHITAYCERCKGKGKA